MTASSDLTGTSRISSIDIIRGAVMILMAIDHVRVFSGLPAGGPTADIFFTRWITHFCAPAFIFLAGTSSFFYGRKHGNLSRFFITRGAWLIVLELTFLRVAWTFNFDFSHYLLAGVIWVIGWCMILMAGIVKLPRLGVVVVGVVIIAGHNLFDPHLGEMIASMETSNLSGLWKILYMGFFGGPIQLGANGPAFWILYSIVPWIGVMALGYAFGKILTLDAAKRNRICLTIGLSAIAAFVILRGFNLYGDPRPWGQAAQPGAGPMLEFLQFLNTNKYPASLLFLLMTLGPAIAMIPLLEKARGRVVQWVTVFGRVPFFYYMLHIPLIHLLAIFVSWIKFGAVSSWLFMNHPMGNPPAPEAYVWSLPLLYLIFTATIVILYFPCRWFAELKSKRKDWWLSYL